ncbi:MAG: HD domain-containing protein [Thermodesulfobacteriota bacterium]
MKANLEQRLAGLAGHPALAAVLALSPDRVFLVGGAVRDLILGRPARDLDLAVAGLTSELAERAAGWLGVKAVTLGRWPQIVYRFVLPDLTLDLGPLDGAIEADLARRDLTINALALDLKSLDRSGIIDCGRGRRDLEEGIVRFVSEQAVLDDPLRLLRLFRFSAALNFKPDPESLTLVRRRASMINRSAGERLREELLLLLSAPNCRPVILAMLETGLWEALIPETTPLRDCRQGGFHHLDVLDHTLLALARLEEFLADPNLACPGHVPEIKAYLANSFRPALLKLTVLFHDLGKPAARSEDATGVHFFGHEKIGEKTAADLAGKLKLSGEETDLVRLLVKNHLRPFHLWETRLSGRLTTRALYRLGRDLGDHLWGLVLHALADAAATAGPDQVDRGGLPAFQTFILEILGEIRKQKLALATQPRLLGGRDLMAAFNLKPSPLLGRILEAILEEQALGRVTDRGQALALAETLIESLSQNNSPIASR